MIGTAMLGILMYLSYGGAGRWTDEATFSILSALRYPLEGVQIVVVTDTAALWEKLPVRVEPVSTETMTAWTGPHAYAHRRKILALRHVLERFQTPTVYLDADTYFTKSPSRLFERIGPGRSVMHLREGTLGIVQGEMHHALHAFLSQSPPLRNRDGSDATIPAQSDMWNAGVIGLDPANIGLLDDAAHLCDQLTASLSVHTLEMFALSWYLSQQTTLQPAEDIVYHYWLPRLRATFATRTAPALVATASMPAAERAAAVWGYRPRPSPIRVARNRLRDMLRGMGFLQDRLRGQG